MTPETTYGSTEKDAAATTKDAVSDVTQSLKSGAKEMVDSVSAEAARVAHQAQGSAAEEVRNVASALRTAADEMRSGSPQERTFSQLADGLADAADAMRDKDLGEMMGSLNGFAREQPLTFLGGPALLGFAATRFAKASAKSKSGTSQDNSQDDGSFKSGQRRHEGMSGTSASAQENTASPAVGAFGEAGMKSAGTPTTPGAQTRSDTGA